MTRSFTARQRKILQLLSGNKCSICGVFLGSQFHADHVQPYSKGGKTVIQNGQALCPKCNLRKGVRHG